MIRFPLITYDTDAERQLIEAAAEEMGWRATVRTRNPDGSAGSEIPNPVSAVQHLRAEWRDMLAARVNRRRRQAAADAVGDVAL